MPITKSARKNMRGSARKQVQNLKTKQVYKKAVKTVREGTTPEGLKAAFKALDKAAKTGVIHAGKASRLKSRISKNPA